MQRFILLTCLTAFLMTSQAFAQQMQQMEDVVHLKNGGLIRGTIIEQVPGESMKIQTRDGNIFVYMNDEIAKITKEPVMGIIKKKNPWVAFFLSTIITGGGQFYNGQYLKGVAQLGGAIIGIGFILNGIDGDYRSDYYYSGGERYSYSYYVNDDDKITFGALLWFGSNLWSMIDAPISANRINKQSQQPSYGHLIELGGSRTTLGVDPVVSHKNLGTRLTLHF